VAGFDGNCGFLHAISAITADIDIDKIVADCGEMTADVAEDWRL
jgi:hypothetical protein